MSAMARFDEAQLALPVQPFALGELLAVLPAHELAAVALRYYDACATYNSAYAEYCGVVKESLEGKRLAFERDSESTSAASQESQEPASSVSIGSSASSGKARRRARYRAARNKRVVRAVSVDTYTVRSPRISESEEGYCYLRMVIPSARDSLRARLGPAAKFSSLLALDERLLVPDRSAMFVERTREGMYHLGGTGFSVDVCFASVVAKAKVLGFRGVPGTIGAYYESRSSTARYVDKAPDLGALLGGKVFVLPADQVCGFCSAALDYEANKGGWVEEVHDVDAGIKTTNTWLVQGEAAVMVMTAVGSRLTMFESRDKSGRAMAQACVRQMMCNKHSARLSGCECRPGPAYLMLAKDLSDVVLVACTGRCSELGTVGAMSLVWHSVRETWKLVKARELS